MDEKFTLGDSGITIALDTAFEQVKFDFNFKTVLINIRTLVRNAMGAYIDKQNTAGLVRDIHARVAEDIALTRYHLNNIANTCEMHVYAADYSAVPASIIVKDGAKEPTEKQVVKTKLYEDCVAACMDLVEIMYERELDNKLYKHRDVVVITHYPIDLLHSRQFSSFHLLESHTGAIKSFKDFSSKLNIKVEQESFIPFTRMTLEVFGDKNMYKGGSKDMRNSILKTAEVNNWTPTITEERVLFGLKHHNNVLYNLLKKIRN